MSILRLVFLYFIIYSFLGWLVEGLYNLSTKGTFYKPNFLMLPLKPMYGIAALLLLLIDISCPFWIFLLSAFFIPSMVEYLTGFLLYRFFHLKYWDYSNTPYHLSGYICLRFSIYWLALSLILIYLMQPVVSLFSASIEWFWFYFFPVALIILATDFCISVRSKYKSRLH